MNRARLCPISHNARGICKVSRAQRSEAELWARGILYIPEFCDVAPRAAGERATSGTEGLPARILQKERAPSVSEGGAILQNVSASSEVRRGGFGRRNFSYLELYKCEKFPNRIYCVHIIQI